MHLSHLILLVSSALSCLILERGVKVLSKCSNHINTTCCLQPPCCFRIPTSKHTKKPESEWLHKKCDLLRSNVKYVPQNNYLHRLLYINVCCSHFLTISSHSHLINSVGERWEKRCLKEKDNDDNALKWLNKKCEPCLERLDLLKRQAVLKLLPRVVGAIQVHGIFSENVFNWPFHDI